MNAASRASEPQARSDRRRRPRPRPAARLPRRRRRAVPAGAGPRSRRHHARWTTCRSRSRPASSSRSSVPAAPARRRCWRRSPASRRPASGSVRFDGIDLHANLRKFRGVIGYVPQDDIIHADLPLRHTLRYAARLRLPSSTTAAEIDDAVRAAIDAVGLTEQRRRPGRLAERRAAQARQHRRRAAHRPARVLPRRADVRPRPGHERGADRPPAPAGRPVGDRRVHHALGRRPRAVRSRRVHGAGRASRLRRHRSTRRSSTSASSSVPELYRRLADPDGTDRRRRRDRRAVPAPDADRRA